MDQPPPRPHVFIFPLPLQGPIKCMLKLAELLCLAGVHATFLNTDHNHRRLLRHTAVQTRFSAYPQFRFDTISDGLPDDHPRSGDRFMDLFNALETVSKPLMREMLFSCSRSCGARWPVTCVIADGALTFALEVAEEVGIPLICSTFCAFFVSACNAANYLNIKSLLHLTSQTVTDMIKGKTT